MSTTSDIASASTFGKGTQMNKDPGWRYLSAINRYNSLSGCNVLEVGCGNGAMTHLFATQAEHITAVDTDRDKLAQAQLRPNPGNVTFLHTDATRHLCHLAPYDMAIYTLSLHHIAPELMQTHILQTTKLLKQGAPILIIEPGESGTFMEIKKEFGAGSGDETEFCRAALSAITNLSGFTLDVCYSFDIDLTFSDETDFFRSKMPGYASLPEEKLTRLKHRLQEQRQKNGITLTAQRWLYRLQPPKIKPKS